jgi:hypothetical protein
VTVEVNEMSESTRTSTNGATAKGAPRKRGTRVPPATDTGPIVVPSAGAAEPAAPSAAPPPTTPAAPAADPTPGTATPAPPPADDAPHAGAHPTAPVTARPRPRAPRRGPLTRMGPWAPVAGGLLGLLGGVVAVLLLARVADTFADRLALVLLVVGLGMLGTAGTLLADEVRMVRQGAREAAVRPSWVEATVPLLSGLTPARLLLVMSAFVLFLAAFVTR